MAVRRGEGTPPYGCAVHLVAMRRGEGTPPYRIAGKICNESKSLTQFRTRRKKSSPFLPDLISGLQI